MAAPQHGKGAQGKEQLRCDSDFGPGESFDALENPFGKPGREFRSDHHEKVASHANAILEKERLDKIQAEKRNAPPPPSSRPGQKDRTSICSSPFKTEGDEEPAEPCTCAVQ
jgi:hypothetical protein